MSPEEIKGLRMTLGLSQEQAAKMAGIRARTIRNWEKGRTKPLRTKLRYYRTMMMATDNADITPLLRVMQAVYESTEATPWDVSKRTGLPTAIARTLLLKLCRLQAVEQFEPGWFAIRSIPQPPAQRA